MTEALKWYLKAAKQGDAAAQCTIGAIYHNGDGVPVDEIEGLAWVILAAEKGNKPMIQMRDMAKRETEYKLGPEAVLKAQQRSKELAEMIEATQRPK